VLIEKLEIKKSSSRPDTRFDSEAARACNELRWASSRAARAAAKQLQETERLARRPLVRKKSSETRRAYWASAAGLERRRKAALARDLRSLAVAIATVRQKIISRDSLPQKAEQKRQVALSAWNARGRYKRRQKSLESAFRSALRKAPRAKASNLQSLVKVANGVGRRFHQRINTKLLRKLRRYFEKAFASGSKSQRARELIGCTIPELRRYLEKQFRPGMTWANHSFTGWHIDHRRPLASFDLSDQAQQRQAFHFTNLQPLWMKENMAKHDSWQKHGGLPR